MKFFFHTLLGVLLLYSANSPTTCAQAYPQTELLQGMAYRCVGPFRGGRVTAAAGIPEQPAVFFMGSTGGGVWKTADYGETWQNLSDGQFCAGSIGAVEVARSNPQVMYVGTGSADPRGNISPGCGMYKTQNGGKTWQHIGLDDAGQIARIQIHPQNPDLVYAAVLGNIFGPNTTRGVFRSNNGGNTWEKVLYLSDTTGAVDLAMHPTNPEVLYAGFWRAERKPWTFIDGGKEGGLYKTTNGGSTWEKITDGLPTGVVGRIGIAISPANPDRIWVQQEAMDEKQGGLFRSDNGGESWEKVNYERKLRQRAWYYSRIFADPQDENTLYALNVDFFKSVDGGKAFQEIAVPHGDNHYLWINPYDPQTMVQTNDGGANISVNGGETWSTQFNQPTAEFYRVSVDHQFPYRLYGAQQDNSTISVPSRPMGDITPKQHWYSIGGGESGHIAVDPRNPNIVYAGNYIGQIDRVDLSSGHSRNIVAYPQMHDGVAPRNIRYRFQWNAPIRLSPHNPDVLYHCSQFVHRSTDGGQSWETISPDLTTNQDAYHDIPGGPIQHDHTGVELYTTIFSFEESPHEAGVLWAGSDDGLLHISRNNGETWEDITPSTMPKEGTINTIALSAHAPGRAFLAVYKYRENDFSPYIFRTDNYGQNWQLLTNGQNGIPSNHFVRVVREDPKRKGLLYAGTEFGMYLSFDDGKNWQPFQRNLPVTPITDMLIHENDLVMATQGRSFWIMDDLSPLQQLTPEIAKAPSHLFAPRVAYRTQMRNYRGAATPDPAPNGATIYFWLQDDDPQKTITLTIKNLKGENLKKFSTAEQKGASLLKVQQGLNRLVWNLTGPAPDVTPGSFFSLSYTGGINMPPGTYKIVLEHQGQQMEQALTIKPDPRWKASVPDLEAQYELARQALDLLNEAHVAIRKLRSIRKQVKAINQKLAKHGEAHLSIVAQGEQVMAQLTALEEELIQHRHESGQDPINFPPKLDDQIAYLYSTVNFQDAKPNQGAYERYNDLDKALQPLLDKLNAIAQGDLQAFEAALDGAEIPHVMVVEEGR